MPIGTRLQGRYLIGRCEGQIDESSIRYLAYDTRQRQRVWVREFFPGEWARRSTPLCVEMRSQNDAAAFAFGLSSFLAEARVFKRRAGRSVAKILKIITANGTGYVIEEFGESLHLAEFLARQGGRLHHRDALELLLPILAALRKIHAQGVLHLDIRPENVLVRASGEAYLTGFSGFRISFADRLLASPSLACSPYLPLELQLSRSQVGPWSDVYSCAAMTYWLLTGRKPQEALERIERDPLIPLQSLEPRVPEPISTAVMAGLAPNPTQRPQSIAEFKSMLTRAVNSPRQNAKTVTLDRARRIFRVMPKQELVVGLFACVAIIVFLELSSLFDAPLDLSEDHSSPKVAAAFADVQPRIDQAYHPDDGGVSHSELQRILHDPGSGSPADWFRLGSAFERGEDATRSLSEAVKWYRKAAEGNSPEAQSALGRLYLLGKDKGTREQGFYWYQRAAQQGSADAQFGLGVAYELGLGVAPSMRRALKWYFSAAERGHALAQNRLGNMFDEGQGVPVDDKEALRWYRLAAEQGDGDAQYNLGLMYLKGEGTAPDQAEAELWLKRAAKAGQLEAQAKLKALRG